MSKNNNEVKRSWFFIVLLTISSLVLAGSAAYFSIFGLSKLFYGAGLGIIILASALEFSKLVAVSYVYRYWKVIAKALRAYYVFGVVFIMLLTSIGVYGFLTSAYQKSANKVEIRDSQIKIAENKKNLFVAQLDRINKTIESDNNRINQLSNVRGLQERRLDTLYNRRQTSNAKRTETSIAGADEQIKFLNTDITEKMKQANSVNDSIAYYDQRIIEYKASDVSSEVGPLKYLADLTGIAMNKVVNILVLLIIFVFDPMAIALLIGVNQLTMMEKSDSDLKHERIKIPKLGNLFGRKKEEDEKEEEDKVEEEKIETPPVETQPEQKESVTEAIIKKIPSFFYKEQPEESETEEIEEDEKVDSKKNEFHFEDCPEGYSQERVDLDISDIREGIKVYHNTFGEGIVTKLEKGRVFIKFDTGTKELSPEYANLKEIKCVKKEEEIEAVPYLDFAVDDPEIQDILIKREEQTPSDVEEPVIVENEMVEPPVIVQEPEFVENTVVEEPVVETNVSEKKTKLFQKIWRGKKII